MWALIRLWSRVGNLMLVTSAVMRRELGEHACSKLDVWMRGVDTELFNPKHKSAEFKARGGAGITAPLSSTAARLHGKDNNISLGPADSPAYPHAEEDGRRQGRSRHCLHRPPWRREELESELSRFSEPLHNFCPPLHTHTEADTPALPSPQFCRDVLERIPGATLCFVGDGPQRAELEARTLRLSNSCPTSHLTCSNASRSPIISRTPSAARAAERSLCLLRHTHNPKRTTRRSTSRALGRRSSGCCPASRSTRRSPPRTCSSCPARARRSASWCSRRWRRACPWWRWRREGSSTSSLSRGRRAAAAGRSAYLFCICI